MKIFYLLAFCLATISSSALAEYRAFELLITNLETGNERKVYSILDHIQYPEYYPLAKNEAISYVDSWMCWGRSENYKPLCPNPKRSPSSVPKPNSTNP